MAKTRAHPAACGCTRCRCHAELRCRCHDLNALIALTLWDYGRSLRHRRSAN
ncbi:MAG: hypothetical protein H3C27_10010 [Opitutaceae bacterium]|nr:hypothetical protein [Opitutaceae bacterium]